jgi:hypothetical protein
MITIAHFCVDVDLTASKGSRCSCQGINLIVVCSVKSTIRHSLRFVSLCLDREKARKLPIQ